MTKIIIFPKNQQIKFLNQVKKNSNLSWEKLAYEVGISRSMIFNYKNATNRVTSDNFDKLCEIGKIDKNNFQLKFLNKFKIEIKQPTENTDIAEFIGILAGNGHVNDITYEVSVTCHKINDKNYIDSIVLPLFIKLFAINPKISFQENTIRCRVYSRRLVEFLHSTYNVPIGKKKKKLRIPRQFFGKKYLIIPFLRGIFDTDGSVYTHHGKDIMLEVSSHYPQFRKDLIKALRILDFHPSEGIKNVRLYRQKEVKVFFNLIRPNNKNHIKRFMQLQKHAPVIQSGLRDSKNV